MSELNELNLETRRAYSDRVDAELAQGTHPRSEFMCATALVGKDVGNRKGESLGELKEMVLDTRTGSVLRGAVVWRDPGHWLQVVRGAVEGIASRYPKQAAAIGRGKGIPGSVLPASNSTSGPTWRSRDGQARFIRITESRPAIGDQCRRADAPCGPVPNRAPWWLGGALRAYGACDGFSAT